MSSATRTLYTDLVGTQVTFWIMKIFTNPGQWQVQVTWTKSKHKYEVIFQLINGRYLQGPCQVTSLRNPYQDSDRELVLSEALRTYLHDTAFSLIREPVD